LNFISFFFWPQPIFGLAVFTGFIWFYTTITSLNFKAVNVTWFFAVLTAALVFNVLAVFGFFILIHDSALAFPP
jgi:fatty acid desaturase